MERKHSSDWEEGREQSKVSRSGIDFSALSSYTLSDFTGKHLTGGRGEGADLSVCL